MDAQDDFEVLEDLPTGPEPPSRVRQALIILWPAFMMAGVLEMLVFAVVDPGSLHWVGVQPLDWSAQAVYGVAFFVFWAVIAISGAITQWLCSSSR